MNSMWVLCANASRARLFIRHKPHAELEELPALTHPASRQKASERGSDEPGVGFERAGHGMHAKAEPTPLKESEAKVFAKEVAKHLQRAFEHQQFKQLVIIAAPAFLGLLRKQLNNTVHASIIAEIDKDLSQLPPAEISQYLPNVF